MYIYMELYFDHLLENSNSIIFPFIFNIDEYFFQFLILRTIIR